MKDYIVDVVFATREPAQKGMKELAPLIEYGASPRASIALDLAARAHAFLRHRGYVTPEDVKAIGPDVLRHRVVLTLRGRGRGGHRPSRSSGASSRWSRSRDRAESTPKTQLIPQELLKQLRTIEIHTARLANEQLSGTYTSCFKGRGSRSARCAPYQPGDDVRTIDWNVSARMNETFVKVFVEEREMTVMLVVDLSASEQFGTQRASKARVAAEVARALRVQRDQEQRPRRPHPRRPSQVEKHRAAEEGREARACASSARSSGFEPERTPGTEPRSSLLETLVQGGASARSVAFVISDFFATGFERALALAAAKHDVIPVMLVDPRDEELPDVGLATFEDLETGEDGARRHRATSACARTTQQTMTRAAHERAAAVPQARARLSAMVRTDGSSSSPLRELFAQARAEDPHAMRARSRGLVASARPLACDALTRRSRAPRRHARSTPRAVEPRAAPRRAERASAPTPADARAATWASCVEHVPPGATRPVDRGDVPGRGTAATRRCSRSRSTHGKGETRAARGLQARSRRARPRAPGEGGLRDPRSPTAAPAPGRSSSPTGRTARPRRSI